MSRSEEFYDLADQLKALRYYHASADEQARSEDRRALITLVREISFLITQLDAIPTETLEAMRQVIPQLNQGIYEAFPTSAELVLTAAIKDQ